MSDRLLQDLRLADVETFIAVCRTQSVSNVARQLGVTPSQVSKAVTRLERQFQMKLVERRAGKSVPSASGIRAAQMLDEVVRTLQAIRAADPFGDERVLGVASPSYLLGPSLATIAGALPKLRLRGIELAPFQIRGSAADGLFDMALTTSAEGFGGTWLVERIGTMRSVLVGSPSLLAKLGGPDPIPVAKLAEVPFITPTYTAQPGVFGDDECPLGVGERRLGHEVSTFETGLEIAARCPQVVFGPILAAQNFVERGLLAVIDIEGWDVQVPWFLVAKQDGVLETTRRSVTKLLVDWLQKYA